MATPFLTTKLYIPPRVPNLVERPHLVKRLDEGLRLGHRLTLISAPAGFGKTTLLSEWIHSGVRSRECRFAKGVGSKEDSESASPPTPSFAWLSLDEGDNDPARFLSYFIAALNRVEGVEPSIGEGALGMLQSPQPPPSEAVLISVINEMAAIPDRIVLVLDDYHLIESSPVEASTSVASSTSVDASTSVDEALTFLIEHLPPPERGLHLVIATRDDPQLPLARLRARGQLTEVRATDLRFTPSEAAEFLNRAMGLDLSAEDIAALESRTEGWIAGLQLAAISMQGQKDAAGFIQSFTGSHRFVLDYLVEEVLDQQSESIQSFLLQTAVLNRLTGPLCNALLDQDDGESTLEMLEHTNLFIIPLDEERRWYRYHHLFADLLHQRLMQTQPERLPMLHRRASEWYEQNGFTDEAIEHALRAEDFERAAHLIDEQADGLWQRGEHDKLQRWLEVIPVDLVLSKPQLCIFRAYYLHSSGQHHAGEPLLQEVEKVLELSGDRAVEDPLLKQNQLSGAERVKLRGRVAVVRALIDSFSGDVPGMIQHANQALEHLPEQDLTWRTLAAFTLGDAHSFLGDMAASYQARSEALRACEAAGDVYYIIIASLKLASTLREQGELQRTLEVCRQQVQGANEYGLSQTSPVGCLMALWGETLSELNDLDGAIHQAMKGAKLAEGGASLAILGYSYLYLMRVLFSRGDLAAAEEIIQKVAHLDRETSVPPWLTNQMATWQARISLVQGKLDSASQWVEERGLNTHREPKTLDGIDFLLLFDYIMLARVLIAQSRLDEATGLLQQLARAAEMGGRTTRVIEILMLEALAFQAGGDTAEAMDTLERALTLAEPGGFVRIFVDEGPPMARLLYEMLSRADALPRGVVTDYARHLLSAFPVVEPEHTASPETQAPSSELVEPLSERELEVLQLIAEGLTNQEIAARLFLSLNTVKAHTRNIYGKLGVHNRTQAVARAKALGVLPST